MLLIVIAEPIFLLLLAFCNFLFFTISIRHYIENKVLTNEMQQKRSALQTKEQE